MNKGKLTNRFWNKCKSLQDSVNKFAILSFVGVFLEFAATERGPSIADADPGSGSANLGSWGRYRHEILEQK